MSVLSGPMPNTTRSMPKPFNQRKIMKPKIIRTEADYETALARIDVLMDGDPDPSSAEGEELELLCLLVGNYEEIHYPMDLPSPVEAIKFRMEQQGLKAKDLIPYLGSASKVSEVLTGKRPLSLTMIRKLVNGLGIPAEVLLQEPGADLPSEKALQEGRHFPVAEMVRRGWFAGFHGTVAEAKAQLEDLLSAFVSPLGQDALMPAMNRQHIRNGGKQDAHALAAWRIRVATLALRESLPSFKVGALTPDFLRELAHLSYLDSGPLLAREFLNKNGIHLICERHLPKTHLDGAALKLPDGSPVVAVTLRYDRLDYFWFTLFHELAHVALHLYESDLDTFFDELSGVDKTDRLEVEADQFATESLIPSTEWKAARLKKNAQTERILAFAEKHRISPAIPAGRIRYETKDYTIFRSLVGNGKVRSQFGVPSVECKPMRR
ncbi:MAG: ImmA/IrrE family metallo-endopeptidase [Puniceicoccaceae bacterium]|nr:MAG: ImmA/IrrE family metallo-endopeptidase [Puniceicoccaceae bacterium]